MYLMATLTLEASYWQVMLPRFIQGLGIGFTFVPLSTVALSAVSMRELGHASGLFNFIRTIGGASASPRWRRSWSAARRSTRRGWRGT